MTVPKSQPKLARAGLKNPHLRMALLFAVAVLLLVLLILSSGLTWSRFVALVLGMSWTGFALVVAASVVQMWCGAWKWRLVVGTVAPGLHAGTKLGFYYFYTSLGAFLALFMPYHLSSAAARSGALKLHHGVKLTRGAATSFYDQAFDLIVPALLVPVALLSLAGRLSLAEWLVWSSLSVLVGGLAIVAVSARVTALALPARPGSRFAWLDRANTALAVAHEAGLFDRRLVASMLSLSLLRYLAHLARVLMIAWTLGLDLDLFHIAQLLPLMQLALILAFTPGSLGIAEWTWVGLLAVTGVGLATAGEFALLHRVVVFASLAGVLILAGGAFLFGHKRAPDRARAA